VTLSDIGRTVGVAPSTVSYILRKVEPHFSRYSKDTIARVEEAARDAGYTPNLLATSLRLQQVPYFGIFFEFVRRGDLGPTGGLSTMMWRVFEGVASAARKDGRYPVVLTSPDPHAGLADSPEELDRVVRSGLAGVIAAVFPDTWKNHLARWEASGVPCISVFDAGPPDAPRWYVDLDNHAVGRLAWEHLSSHGHRRVICLCQEGLSGAAADRVEAFISMQNAATFDTPVVEVPWSMDGHCRVDEQGQDRILEAVRGHEATAIFCPDGGASVIAYEVLANHGVAVPGQCSLIGIDVPVWSPASLVVTEVACPGRTVGEQAARLLAARLDGKRDDAPQSVRVPPVLIERASVAKLGARG
jgi:LacI family transcriptional regulator